MVYQELFNYMKQEFDVLLLESDAAEIERIIENKQKAESEQCNIADVSISLERAKKYARHQHFLGTQGRDLVEFEDWAAKD